MYPGMFFTPPDDPHLGGPTWPDDPLIYLAGPIQGVADWQAEAYRHIRALDGDIHIASPRRLGSVDLSEEDRVVQYRWEQRWLAYAAMHGCTLFWCTNETTPRWGTPFAQTMRYELGKQSMKRLLAGARMVVGFDAEFTGWQYLHRDLAAESRQAGMEPPPFASSLEETCAKAVEIIHGMYRPRVRP